MNSLDLILTDTNLLRIFAGQRYKPRHTSSNSIASVFTRTVSRCGRCARTAPSILASIKIRHFGNRKSKALLA